LFANQTPELRELVYLPGPTNMLDSMTQHGSFSVINLKRLNIINKDIKHY